MHGRRSLRERLDELVAPAHLVFEASSDPVLVQFTHLFADSGLYSLDATKHLRTDAWSPIYDCETELRPSVDAEPEIFSVLWTPVWHGVDPVTGFREGSDSAVLGTSPTVAMPQDERTASLLLLVTSAFVHLSASGDAAEPLVQGVVDTDQGYRYVVLSPDAVPGVSPRTPPTAT